MLQDSKGQYPHSGHALIFEGSMLVYDPQWDFAQWVSVRGTLATLNMTELRMANDLHNMVPPPHDKVKPARPLSPQLVKGVPAGAESNTESSTFDSGNEWDNTEAGATSHCSTPTARMGPTWEEVHAAVQEVEMTQRQGSSWEDIVNKQSCGGTDEDWDVKEESQSAMDLQSKNTPSEEDEEELAGKTPTEETKETTLCQGSQDVEPIHAGEGDSPCVP